jgi:hypothetical protein
LRISNVKRVNANKSKIFSKIGMFFRPPQRDRQKTTIHHESAINSPQIHHQETLTFPKPLQKSPQNNKKSPGQRRSFFSYQNLKKIKR